MSIEILMYYLQPNILILIIFLWVLQQFLKLNPKFNKEYVIPYCIFIIAIISALLITGQSLGNFTDLGVYIAGISQGAIVAGIVVFFEDKINNIFIKEKPIKKEEVNKNE